MTPFEYKSTSDFTEGMALVEKDSKVGYYDLDFKMPIPIQYDNGRSFSQGLAAVNKGATGTESWSKKGGKWGFIDKTGAVIIPFIYDEAFSFQENGKASVKKDGKSLNINTRGEIVQ